MGPQNRAPSVESKTSRFHRPDNDLTFLFAQADRGVGDRNGPFSRLYAKESLAVGRRNYPAFTDNDETIKDDLFFSDLQSKIKLVQKLKK